MASFDPVVGHEISKKRPVVVISNDVGNKHSGTVTVVPVTSKNLGKIYPFEVYLPTTGSKLEKESKAKADQIRTLDKKRLIKKIGVLDAALVSNVDKAIKIHLDLN